MSAAKPGQYGEPWHTGPYYKTDVESSQGRIAECRLGTPDGEVKAARIVACVNALDGLDPAALAGLIEAAVFAECVLRQVANPHAEIAARQKLEKALEALGVRQ